MAKRKTNEPVGQDGRQPTAIREPTYTEIQERAYFRYVERGRIDGFDREDWYLAETALRDGEQAAIRGAGAPVRGPDRTYSDEVRSQTSVRRRRSGARLAAG